ncbi:MAG: carbamoyltransferase HypF [Clostridiales Family XIII bacterium]|jgi:hydrogenase maturation protein HypF|nr:carbamoyltransferase HypF [Clostridiales Family XIII bacterium]
MITEVVTFWGIVQGVGFRPTLSRIAAKYRMRGQVRNMGAFVQLIVTDEPERIDAFIGAVRAGKPRMAEIMSIGREIIDTAHFDDFRIVSSAAAEDEIVAVPADIAVCDECLAEFRNTADPRYRHPFISCVNCGPRYTIMERLPYDRDTTTMNDFPMCGFCEGEYTDPASRRYHAQTVSCNSCGPVAIWRSREEHREHKGDVRLCEKPVIAASEPQSHPKSIDFQEIPDQVRDDGSVFTQSDGSFCVIHRDGAQKEPSPLCSESESAISAAIDAIKGGGVIALKGVGGYYFVCSPFDESAVRKLREIKVREYKPFAVMFASVEQAREYCEISPEEEAMLTSPKRPIVLLEQRRERTGGSPFDLPAKRSGIRTACSMSPWDIPLPSLAGGIDEGGLPVPFAPGMSSTSRFIGAFLPSMALQYMLIEVLGPLIMTSANISDLPIIKDDDEMFAALTRNEHREHKRDGRLCEKSVIAASEPQSHRKSIDFQEIPDQVRDDGSVFTQSDGSFCVQSGQTAQKEPSPLCSGVLYNERRIVRRLDDSVVRVIDGTAQLIRRSKGWTPVPIYVRGTDRLTKNDQMLAVGADLKSAFALTKGSFVYMSQYIGDMDNIETEQVYEDNLESMRKFFRINPRLIACDTHPLYRTVELAKEYARGAELLPVQHHHAHIASVMAEHGLEGPVVGVAFDGTGYGADGTIWGGEILICEGVGAGRFSHLRDIPMTGGDESMRDGWKSAVCRAAKSSLRPPSRNLIVESIVAPVTRNGASGCFDIDISYALKYAEENDTLREYEAERKTIEAAVAQGVNTVRTSSMGRLFDAVASLLGICHVNRYEGECAVTLENAADRAQRSPGVADTADALALRFHMDVAHAILGECRKARAERGIDTVCLSGGVFQNKILMERTLRLLRSDGFTPYYNISVPPNDGGIALGQAYIAMRTQ